MATGSINEKATLLEGAIVLATANTVIIQMLWITAGLGLRLIDLALIGWPWLVVAGLAVIRWRRG